MLQSYEMQKQVIVNEINFATLLQMNIFASDDKSNKKNKS
jgi:hypothetical protein